MEIAGTTAFCYPRDWMSTETEAIQIGFLRERAPDSSEPRITFDEASNSALGSANSAPGWNLKIADLQQNDDQDQSDSNSRKLRNKEIVSAVPVSFLQESALQHRDFNFPARKPQTRSARSNQPLSAAFCRHNRHVSAALAKVIRISIELA